MSTEQSHSYCKCPKLSNFFCIPDAGIPINSHQKCKPPQRNQCNNETPTNIHWKVLTKLKVPHVHKRTNKAAVQHSPEAQKDLSLTLDRYDWDFSALYDITKGSLPDVCCGAHFLKSGALVIDGSILYIMMQGLTVIYGRKTTQCCFNFNREIFLCTTCSIRTTLCKLATYHSSPRPQREARPNELSAITIRRCNIWNYFPSKPANIKTHTVVCVALPLISLHSHHRLAFIVSKKVDFLKLDNAKRRGKNETKLKTFDRQHIFLGSPRHYLKIVHWKMRSMMTLKPQEKVTCNIMT